MNTTGIHSACCKASLEERDNELVCGKCGRKHPVTDCYLDMPDIYEKGTKGPLSLVYNTGIGVSLYRTFRSGVLKALGGDVMGEQLETLFVALALDVGKTGNYLDLSCGPGQHARALCGYNPDIHVYGLDISRNMLSLACKRPSPNITFIRADAQKIPFVDSFFDGVYCLAAMYLYPDRARILSEVFRVLKPGSRFVSVDFNKPGKGFTGYAIRQAMKAVNVSFTNEQAVRKGFKDHGFQAIIVHNIGLLIVTLAEKINPNPALKSRF